MKRSIESGTARAARLCVIAAASAAIALLGVFLTLRPLEAETPRDSEPYVPRAISSLEDLGFSDLHAVGERPTLEVFFPGRGDFELGGRSKLTLFLAYSNLLAPQLSSVTVSMNGRALTSIPLNAPTATGARHDIDLPNSVLRQDFNRMSLQFAMSRGVICDDPLHPGLWAMLLKDSFEQLDFIGEPPVARTEDPRLDPYPYPFFRGGYPPAAPVIIVLPTDPLGPEIAGAYRLAADLAQRVTIDTTLLDVQPADALTPEVLASHQLIVLGTPERQPLLTQLLPGVTATNDGTTLSDTRKIGATDGYLRIAESPWNPALRALTITGATMPAVLRGVDALTTPDASALLTGTEAVLVQPIAETTRREEVASGVTFAQRGIQDHTAVGLTDSTDVTFISPALNPTQHATLDLIVSTPDSLDRTRSNVVIELNSALVQSVTFRDTTQQRATYRVDLPGRMLRVGTNTLRLRTTLYPFELGDLRGCDSIAPERLWATYHRESVITFPSAGDSTSSGRPSTLAELPAPFVGPFGLRDTTFVIAPERPASLRGGMNVAIALARRGPTNDLRVVRPSDPVSSIGDRHLVAVGVPPETVIGKELTGALPLAFRDGSVRALTEKDALLAAIAGSSQMGAIQIAPAPIGKARGLLTFDATDDEALSWTTTAITANSFTGNVAVFRSPKLITPLTIAWSSADAAASGVTTRARLQALLTVAPVALIALTVLGLWFFGPRLRQRLRRR